METDGRTATTVVDVTYLCDARCRYCRWGDPRIPGRVAQDLSKTLISAGMLERLGTERIVISGGEPTLHPYIERILGHYRSLVEQVIVITNGYGLSGEMLERLLGAGATGITVSLDSASAIESFMTRRTPPRVHARILRNMERAGGRRGCELGINSTVSHVTANWLTVQGLLELSGRVGADFVKFQPIFDDGYVSANSPDLLLTYEDEPPLREVGRMLGGTEHVSTNPPAFWHDVADLAGGGSLPAYGCALDGRDSISVDGGLGICWWVDSSRYGDASGAPDGAEVEAVRERFMEEKRGCTVDYHCFCNQGMGHAWR